MRAKDMRLRIRLAEAGDLNGVQAIVQHAYGTYLSRMAGQRPGPMDADYAAQMDAGELYVADTDNGIAGLLIIREYADHLLLDNVAVDPAFQGRGVGRALIAFAEDRAREAGFTEIRLYTHAKMIENQKLYAALGYRETGRHEQDGFDRVFMVKPLTSGA